MAQTEIPFAGKFDRLQAKRVKAFGGFRDDVAAGSFPENKYILKMHERELDSFMKAVGK